MLYSDSPGENQRQKQVEMILGLEMDKLNEQLYKIEDEKNSQEKQLSLYDAELRIQIENVRENQAIIEKLKKEKETLENSQHVEQLCDELSKSGEENDSLKNKLAMCDSELKTKMQELHQNQVAIKDLEKAKEKFKSDLKMKDKSIQDMESDKNAFKDALNYIQKQEIESNAQIFKKVQQLQFSVDYEKARNHKLEQDIFKLKQLVKSLEIRNEKLSKEAKCHLEKKVSEMKSAFEREKLQMEKHKQAEIEDRVQLERKLVEVIERQNSRLVKQIAELNTVLEEKSIEVKTQSDLNVKLSEQIRILETSLDIKINVIQSQAESCDNLAKQVEVLEKNLEAKNTAETNYLALIQDLENKVTEKDAVIQHEKELYKQKEAEIQALAETLTENEETLAGVKKALDRKNQETNEADDKGVQTICMSIKTVDEGVQTNCTRPETEDEGVQINCTRPETEDEGVQMICMSAVIQVGLLAKGFNWTFFRQNSHNILSHLACSQITNKSRSEPGNAPRIGIGHREVVCQK